MSSIRQRLAYRESSRCKATCRCVRCTLDHRYSPYCRCEACEGLRRLGYVGFGMFRLR